MNKSRYLAPRLKQPSLRVYELDKLADDNSAEVDVQKLLFDLIAQPESPLSLANIAHLYLDLSKAEKQLFVYLLDDLMLSKILWPLKSAKACYCLGQYLACIALCGFISEMLIIVLYDAKHAMKQPNRQNLMSRFERDGQQKRINKIEKLELVDAHFVQSMKEICEIRRQHLHFITNKGATLARDAAKAFEIVSSLIMPVLAVKVGKLQNGGIGLHADPDMIRWVEVNRNKKV